MKFLPGGRGLRTSDAASDSLLESMESIPFASLKCLFHFNSCSKVLYHSGMICSWGTHEDSFGGGDACGGISKWKSSPLASKHWPCFVAAECWHRMSVQETQIQDTFCITTFTSFRHPGTPCPLKGLSTTPTSCNQSPGQDAEFHSCGWLIRAGGHSCVGDQDLAWIKKRSAAMLLNWAKLNTCPTWRWRKKVGDYIYIYTWLHKIYTNVYIYMYIYIYLLYIAICVYM